MNINCAQKLTSLFATATAVAYPFLLPKAHISTTNARSTQFEATAHHPAEAAEILKAFSSNAGIFTRNAQFGFNAPLQFSMNMVPNAPQNGLRTEVRALHMNFRDNDPHSFVWLHNSDSVNHGPSLDATIAALSRAGNRWEKVNFLYSPNGSHLRILR
jgi:hypothetical protein